MPRFSERAAQTATDRVHSGVIIKRPCYQFHVQAAYTAGMKTPDCNDLSAIQGIIFDLDGTLVDSRLDFTVIRRELDCPEGLGVLEYINTLPADQRNDAEQVVLDHERRGAARAEWMPGARECLAQCRASGIPTAILTRNAREVADLTLSRLGIEVGMLLAREDCPPKPAPEGLLKIAGDWGLSPSRLVYVGDFLYDLQAARSAGMIGCYYDPQNTNRYSAYADWRLEHYSQLVLLTS